MITNEVTFSDKDISDAKEICTLHNRHIPAIKEIRAKLDLGLYEAKQLTDQVWSTVEHPLNVEYDGLDRLERKVKLESIECDKLRISRSDGEIMELPLSKKTIKALRDFGVPSI